MHVALAGADDPSFRPEPLGADDLAAASRRASANAERTLGALESLASSGWLKATEDVIARARRLAAARETLVAELASAALLHDAGRKIRIHGDYRLGQILLSEGDLFIQNLEGHVSWPAAAQREKQSPLRDVASMLRSFSYAAQAALLTRAAARPEDLANLDAWAHVWQAWSSAAFLGAYLSIAGVGAILPADWSEQNKLLRFFMLDRALRELDAETHNRPEWIGLPTNGLLELLEIA
jgi:maltose alpha-D-glucosyltransferase/alpha-amylase